MIFAVCQLAPEPGDLIQKRLAQEIILAGQQRLQHSLRTNTIRSIK
jgi:hypothetical protein